MTWYEYLGVSPDCSRQEIRAAFDTRKAQLEVARQHSQSPALRARVEVEWRAVHAAWEIVGHPVRRRAYDQHLGMNATPRTIRAKSVIPYGWYALFLVLLVVAGINHIAPLPLLIVGGCLILATTLWWVTTSPHRP